MSSVTTDNALAITFGVAIGAVAVLAGGYFFGTTVVKSALREYEAERPMRSFPPSTAHLDRAARILAESGSYSDARYSE